MTERDDDFERELDDVEMRVYDRDAAQRAAEAAAIASRPAELAHRQQRMAEIHEAEEKRLDAAAERADLVRTYARQTAARLLVRGIEPPHDIPVEGSQSRINVWYINFGESGVPKDPPPEAVSHPSKSEDAVFEGTEVHVHGTALDRDGKLYRLTGQYDIEGEYVAKRGADDEREAKRKVFAIPLGDDDISIILRMMPHRPDVKSEDERVYETGGRYLFSRTQRVPQESDESYRQRLDEALKKWRNQLKNLLDSQLTATL